MQIKFTAPLLLAATMGLAIHFIPQAYAQLATDAVSPEITNSSYDQEWRQAG